jgi:hypothetical protein
MRGLLSVVLAGCMVAVALMACSSEEPTPVDTTGAGGSGGTAPAGFESTECGSCVVERCDASWTACAADSACAQYLECFNACPQEAWGDIDAPCEQQCPRTTASKPLIDALVTCRLSGPGSGCSSCNTQLGNGQYAYLLSQSCPTSTDMDECTRCQDENSCEIREERRNSPDGQAFRDCYVDCSTANGSLCGEQCYAQHPAGLPSFAADLSTYLARCLTPCYAPDPVPMCGECLSETCDTSYMEANAHPAGFLFGDCLVPCGDDQACQESCAQKYPPALPAHEAWAACVVATCPTCAM